MSPSSSHRGEEGTECRQIDEGQGWDSSLYNPTSQEEALHQKESNESKVSTLRAPR